MADTLVPCPSAEALEGIAAGQSAPPDLTNHLLECAACARLLQRIRDDNLFLRGFVVDGALPTSPRPKRQHEIAIAGYEILHEIHRGGQGVVYQAVQQSTKRRVAIKVMKQGPFATLADRARFDREIETLGRMNHPNIVAVHDAGVVAGFHYVVMNYVDGETLDQSITPPDKLTPEAIAGMIRLFIKVCDAVHAAHLHGVIHRDLKPSNVRVDSRGEPHVLDFGLAKAVDTPHDSAMTQTGQFVGSLPWASPEQVEGASSRIDLRTDIYSLGAILFQLLTSALPFDVGSSLHDVFDKVLYQEPPRPSSVVAAAGGPRIGDELDTIILKCLSKDPDRRYQSAADLSRDLRRYLDGEPIEAKRDSALYVLRKTMRRYRLRVAVAGALAVLLAVFGAIMAMMYGRSVRLEQSAVHSAESLSKLLASSTIEQGRMAGMLGNIQQAERLLWGQLLTRRVELAAPTVQLNDPPGPTEAYWGLWELYRHNPCRRTMNALNNKLTAASLARDGRGLWVVNADGLVQLIDDTDAVVDSYRVSFPFEPGIPSVDASGRVVAYHSGFRLGIWRRDAGGQPVINVTAQSLSDLGRQCISKSGRLAAIVDNEAAVVWDIDQATELARFVEPSRELTAVAISEDDRQLAVRDLYGGIHLWEIQSQQRLASVRIDQVPRKGAFAVGELCFSPDGRRLADGWAETEGRIWNLDAQPPTFILLDEQPVTGRVHQFSPDSRLLAIGDPSGSLRIIDAATGRRESVRVVHDGRIHTLSFTPDGKSIWTGDENEIRLLDIGAEEGVRTLRAGNDLFHSADLSPDGRRLVAGGRFGVLHRINVATLETQDTPLGPAATVSAIEFSADGSRMLASTYEGDLHIWKEMNPELRPMVLKHPAPIRYACFSPNGRRIASACEDNIVRVWRTDTGTIEQEFAELKERTPQLAFDPAGTRLAAALRSGALVVCHLESGACDTWSPANKRPMRTVRFSPDGSMLYGGGANRVVEIWDVATKKLKAALTGHNQEIYCLDVSRDGRLIASGDSGGAIRLWHTTLQQPVATLAGHTGSVMSLRFSADGRTLVSASLDGTVRLWDLTYGASHIRGNLKAQLARIHADSIDPVRAKAWAEWADRGEHVITSRGAE